ncbi:MAG: hypothetical protein ABIU05_15040, partial [Nitrospirales bacterium]
MTNSPVFSGSKAVEGVWQNVNGGLENPSLWKNFTTSDHIFVRFATVEKAGFQIGSNNATKMIRFRTSGGYPTFSVWLQNYEFITALEGAYRDGTFNTRSGVFA